MIKWINHHHKSIGIIGMGLSALGLLVIYTNKLQLFFSIMLIFWCIYLFVFSLLHAFRGFKISAYFMVSVFCMLLTITLSVYLTIRMKTKVIQNISIILFVILQTTGVIRKWVEEIKKHAGVTNNVDNSIVESTFDEDEFHSPERFLVHSFIQQMSDLMMYPAYHVKNIEQKELKIRSFTLFTASLLLFIYLTFLALEIQIPGIPVSLILTALVLLIYIFIFTLSFYVRGFTYAFKVTVIFSTLIPISIFLYQNFLQLASSSSSIFWFALISLILISVTFIYLILRYHWRKTYNQMTIFKRKYQLIAFAKYFPLNKSYGNTAITIKFKIRENINIIYEIMQKTPADLYSIKSARWGLAGVRYNEESNVVTYLIYANPKYIPNIRRYFNHRYLSEIILHSQLDPMYDEYKKMLPSKSEYFCLYNALAINFYKLDENSTNGYAKVIFFITFSDLKQMNLVEPQFKNVHIEIVERFDPVFVDDKLSEYGEFLLKGEISTNIGIANQMTKMIIDLVDSFDGELYRWLPIDDNLSK